MLDAGRIRCKKLVANVEEMHPRGYVKPTLQLADKAVALGGGTCRIYFVNDLR